MSPVVETFCRTSMLVTSFLTATPQRLLSLWKVFSLRLTQRLQWEKPDARLRWIDTRRSIGQICSTSFIDPFSLVIEPSQGAVGSGDGHSKVRWLYCHGRQVGCGRENGRN